MRIETTYYADDGTEFETEEECRKYESDIDSLLLSVQFFDGQRRLIKHPTMEEIESDAMYMRIIDNEQASRLFSYLHKSISFADVELECSFETGDVLAFDNELEYKWFNLYQLTKLLNVQLHEVLRESENATEEFDAENKN
jgi:hypothetical protein